ncbi:hypothetical protein B0H13DRAFT_1854707 [Mycena leptocephala]|nr:hypothetical protein B0H13DRAFT_1854707 [Mycena leptocephala]
MPLFLSPHLPLITLPVGLPMLLVFGHSSLSKRADPMSVWVSSAGLPSSVALHCFALLPISERANLASSCCERECAGVDALADFYWLKYNNPVPRSNCLPGLHVPLLPSSRRRDDPFEGDSKLEDVQAITAYNPKSHNLGWLYRDFPRILASILIKLGVEVVLDVLDPRKLQDSPQNNI